MLTSQSENKCRTNEYYTLLHSCAPENFSAALHAWIHSTDNTEVDGLSYIPHGGSQELHVIG